ncbi:hypothetical protein [Nocardia sp. NRRL S-836]|uniref:hypothetical protein n=1 Tax=Nocardia sp. NRRL S-836 TaxID=1519492 RepID=UPI0012F750EC|nr:hypothetical protein [Nocardia sp. NRRL S-836]
MHGSAARPLIRGGTSARIGRRKGWKRRTIADASAAGLTTMALTAFLARPDLVVTIMTVRLILSSCRDMAGSQGVAQERHMAWLTQGQVSGPRTADRRRRRHGWLTLAPASWSRW